MTGTGLHVSRASGRRAESRAVVRVGTIEIPGVLTDELHLNGTSWDVVANFDVAALFVAVWATALAN